MTRSNGQITAVTVANSVDQARSLARAVEHYRSRLGEPGIDAELVAQIAHSLEEDQMGILQDAASVGSLLIGPDGRQEIAEATGKGRRSQARGPRSMRDAHYRLLALILGNPTLSTEKEKIYAGLNRYDGKTQEGEKARAAASVKVSEKTEASFASMRLWDDVRWADLEVRLEARMTGAEVAVVASEGCAGCRQSASYAMARGLAVRPCRAHKGAA